MGPHSPLSTGLLRVQVRDGLFGGERLAQAILSGRPAALERYIDFLYGWRLGRPPQPPKTGGRRHDLAGAGSQASPSSTGSSTRRRCWSAQTSEEFSRPWEPIEVCAMVAKAIGSRYALHVGGVLSFARIWSRELACGGGRGPGKIRPFRRSPRFNKEFEEAFEFFFGDRVETLPRDAGRERLRAVHGVVRPRLPPLQRPPADRNIRFRARSRSRSAAGSPHLKGWEQSQPHAAGVAGDASTKCTASSTCFTGARLRGSRRAFRSIRGGSRLVIVISAAPAGGARVGPVASAQTVLPAVVKEPLLAMVAGRVPPSAPRSRRSSRSPVFAGARVFV